MDNNDKENDSWMGISALTYFKLLSVHAEQSFIGYLREREHDEELANSMYVLLYLSKIKSHIPVTELMNTGRSRSTVFNHVKKLIQLELLDQTTDPFDRRLTLISMSEKGKALFDSTQDIREKVWQELFSGITEEEHKILMILLEKAARSKFG